MDLQTERKYIVNKWIINARWFYILGILGIGAITKQGGEINVEFSYVSMISIALFVFVVNIAFYLYIKRGLSKNPIARLNILGLLQITIELVAFAWVAHRAGGVESIALVFNFLPIVSAAMLFGVRGGAVTAILSGMIINAMALAEYYGLIPHIYRYGTLNIEFQHLSVSLVKTLTISVFYLIVGAVTGYGSKLLSKRENALREKTVFLTKERNIVKAMIAGFEDPIIFLDEQNRIEMFNLSAEKILRFDHNAQGAGIVDEDNLSLNNFRSVIRVDYKVVKPRHQFFQLPFEEVTLQYLGREMNYKTVTAPVNGEDGTHYGNMKIFNNITREKIIDRLKSEFISVAAHQLRTPLTVIKWITKSLLDGEAGAVSAEQQDLLRKGYISNERMIELIDNLLNISRIEEGRFDFKFENVDAKEMIDEALFGMKKIAAAKNIKIELKEPDKWPEIWIDKSKMILVLQNLLDNAVKYTPLGGKVEVVLVREPVYLKIVIRDEGIGIPEKDLGRLFSKFYRSSNALRVETEGSGLGLYIAKKIVDGHKGKIYVDSVEGRGSTFVVSLPLLLLGGADQITT